MTGKLILKSLIFSLPWKQHNPADRKWIVCGCEFYQSSWSTGVTTRSFILSCWLCCSVSVCLWRGLLCRERCSTRLLVSSLTSSSAVPTGCSGVLRPCMWRGAEGRHAPVRGGRTGAAGTVLLPQERAVQTAWRSGRHKSEDGNTQQTRKKKKQRRTTTETWGRQKNRGRRGLWEEDERDGCQKNPPNFTEWRNERKRRGGMK